MTFVFFVAVAFFVFSWLATKRGSLILPFDFFAFVVLVLFGPAILLNPLAENEFFFAGHSESHADGALFLLACMYIALGAFCPIRAYVLRSGSGDLLSVRFEQNQGSGRGSSEALKIYRLACFFAVLSFLLVAWSPEYWKSRIDVLRFYTGQLTFGEYEYLRRHAHQESFAVNSILGRIRFSMVPIIYGMMVWSGLVNGFKLTRVALSVLVFFLLGASLSKLPLVYYGGYAWLIYVVSRRSFLGLKFKVRSFVFIAPACYLALLSVLAALLCFQYPAIFFVPGGYIEAMQLANYRVSLVLYEILIRYVKIYPHIEGFVGFESSKLLAGLLGESFRNIDKEVAYYTFGAGRETTSPTIFIAGAYAQFGLGGVVTYTLLVATMITSSEYAIAKMRSSALVVVFYAVLMLNVTFFAQLQALTVLLTYGVGVLLIFAVLNRLIRIS